VLRDANQENNNNINNSGQKLNYDQAEIMQNYFYFNHHIEVPIKCVQNVLYVRISSHIYNNMDDYMFLGNAVLGFIVKNYLTDSFS
jgi:hypothetical protein